MFYQCGLLTDIDISGWTGTSIKSVGNMFYECRNLKTLNAKKLVTTACTGINTFAAGCMALEEIDISQWNTSNVTNIDAIFSNDYNLTYFPLENANLSAVTNSPNIMNSCYGLYSVTIPAINTFGAGAFSNCRSCFEFHFKGTTPPILANTNAFPSMSEGGGRKIYVPYSADHSVLTAYQTATNWSSLSAYMVEEEV